MKNITHQIFALFLGLALVLSVGCKPDPVTPIGPSLDLVSLNGEAVTADTIDAGATFTINVSSLQGDATLNAIEVRENDVAVDPTRIVFDGFQAQSNPNPLAGAANISWDIEITASAEVTTSTYTIIVTDDAQETKSATFDITTIDPGTPVTERTMILLLNAGGPVGTGGLDLETGNGTGSADETADIKDNGIDTNLPLADNWLQTIASTDGNVLKTVEATVVYADVATSEEITAIFDAGMTVTGDSEKVEEGDIFVVQTKEGNTYLLNTTKITVTADNNGDSYEFAVKN